MRWCVVVLLLVGRTASADDDEYYDNIELAALASVGLGAGTQHDSINREQDTSPVLSAQLDVGLRVHGRAMVAAHVAFTSGVTQHDGVPMSMFGYVDEY